MKSLEQYGHSFKEAAARGLYEYQVGTEAKLDLFKKALSPRTGNAERISTAFKFINELLPQNEKIKRLMNRIFEDPKELPFDMERFSFRGRIGSSSECEVLLLESRENGLPSYVLKIQKRDSRDNLDDEVRTLNQEKREYEDIQKLYGAIPDFIPKEFSLIVQNPSKYIKESRIALVQQFQGFDLRDFFDDLSEGEILRLCKQDPKFLTNLRSFLDITQKTLDEQGMIIDIFGQKNLVVARDGNKFKLMFLDRHLFYMKDDKESWDKVNADSFVAYLRHLKRSLDQRFPRSAS